MTNHRDVPERKFNDIEELENWIKANPFIWYRGPLDARSHKFEIMGKKIDRYDHVITVRVREIAAGGGGGAHAGHERHVRRGSRATKTLTLNLKEHSECFRIKEQKKT